MATGGQLLGASPDSGFHQSYFVTFHLRMHLQRCLHDMHQNPDIIRLAGGKGREGQSGHHLIRITMIHPQTNQDGSPFPSTRKRYASSQNRFLMAHRSIMRWRSE